VNDCRAEERSGRLPHLSAGLSHAKEVYLQMPPALQIYWRSWFPATVSVRRAQDRNPLEGLMDGFFESEYALLTVLNVDSDEMRLGQLRTLAVALVLAIAIGIVLRFA
jgi:hypothetical protein